MSDDHPAKPCQGNAPPTGDEPLSRDQALNLFRLYEDKGWAVKQQMLASVGWLTPFVFGLIAYYFTKPASPLGKAAGLTAFCLSLFMAFLTVISLMHANRDYLRSHRVIKYARRKKLLPDDIFQIILRKKDNLDLLKAKRQLTWRRRRRLLWLKHFGYIGWQFIAIMCFAVFVVVVSLVIALYVLLKLVSFHQ